MRSSLTAVQAREHLATCILNVAEAGTSGDLLHRHLLRHDAEIRLRPVLPPYEAIRRGTYDLVLLCGPDAVHRATHLLRRPERPPALLLCPADETGQIPAALRIGPISCLMEGEYDAQTLKAAIRGAATGLTLLSPTAIAAIGPPPASRTRPGATQRRLMLSPRERQVMDLAASGVPAAEIGLLMNLAVKTVRNYLSTIYTKLGVSSLTEAVLLWLSADPRQPFLSAPLQSATCSIAQDGRCVGPFLY